MMNPLKVVSFFAGCGGSSLGYQRAGCKVLLACDFEKRAVETYKMNFPETKTLLADIRNVTGRQVMDLTGIEKVGDLDILDGSPPCTSFSMAGKREDGWGKAYKHASESIVQRSDDLFFEYIRMIQELRPKAFVAENVKGLISGAAKGYYNKIVQGMTESGYKVWPYLLNAKDFEVPQSRPRVIFVGLRNDLYIPKVHDKITLWTHPEISFSQATRGLVIPKDDLENARQLQRRPSSYGWARQLKQGQTASRYHPKGSLFGMHRLREDKPSPTIITTAGTSLVHPTEDRYLTVAEHKRLCTFPDEFKFLSFNDAKIRMGNSVPPNLMKHIALHVHDLLLLCGAPGATTTAVAARNKKYAIKSAQQR